MTVLEERPAEQAGETRTPVLATARLVLRAPQRTDAPAIALLANDRRIAENTLRIPHPYSLADAQAFIAGADMIEDEIVFLVTLAGTVIGACGLAQLDGRTPDIGYWLGAPFWGKGYASEVARALVDYGFGDCGHTVLLAGARVSNPASRRVLEKCGFRWTGVGLYRVRALASSVPVDRFRVERRDWELRK
jgi:RimJ/RimL family protein N-acetyltransferase